jgi:hypothetical protein
MFVLDFDIGQFRRAEFLTITIYLKPMAELTTTVLKSIYDQD